MWRRAEDHFHMEAACSYIPYILALVRTDPKHPTEVIEDQGGAGSGCGKIGELCVLIVVVPGVETVAELSQGFHTVAEIVVRIESSGRGGLGLKAYPDALRAPRSDECP